MRCDGRKSTQILRDCEMLVAEYDGKLLRLYVAARDTRALEQRLLACGVGPITMNIFFARAAPLLDQSVSQSSAGHRQIGKAPIRRPARYDRKSVTFARWKRGSSGDGVNSHQHRSLSVIKLLALQRGNVVDDRPYSGTQHPRHKARCSSPHRHFSASSNLHFLGCDAKLHNAIFLGVGLEADQRKLMAPA